MDFRGVMAMSTRTPVFCTLCTYQVSYSRLKDGEELLLVFDRSSVVRRPNPPIRRRPAGESQLEWPTLGSTSWWLLVQSEPVRDMQLRAVGSPPQTTSPFWVYKFLRLGRGGTEQERWRPEEVRTSTESRLPHP